MNTKQVELIVCWDDGSWTDAHFVDIPEDVYEQRSTDAVVDWVNENHPFERAVQVGIYNWCDDQEN